jgi:hypothetical protein
VLAFREAEHFSVPDERSRGACHRGCLVKSCCSVLGADRWVVLCLPRRRRGGEGASHQAPVCGPGAGTVVPQTGAHNNYNRLLRRRWAWLSTPWSLGQTHRFRGEYAGGTVMWPVTLWPQRSSSLVPKRTLNGKRPTQARFFWPIPQ